MGDLRQEIRKRIWASAGLIALFGTALVGNCLAFGSAGDSVQAATVNGSHPITWLAAGDSYASGAGLPTTTKYCARGTGTDGNSSAWAIVAAKNLHDPSLKLAAGAPDLVACTGAISDEFFHDHTGKVGGPHPEQWTGKRSWLVSFSFGGDDIGFVSILTHCLDSKQGCPPDAAVRQKISALGTAGVYKGNLHIPSYPNFLNHVATAAVNNKGNVIVMGYPDLVEDPSFWPRALQLTGHCQGLISTGTAKLFRGWADDLNATIANAVSLVNAEPESQRNGVHFTFVDPVSGGSDGISATDTNLFEPASGTRHELCSDGDKAWLNGFSKHVLTRSFHPDQSGETAMGKLVDEVIPTLTWPWTPTIPTAACPTDVVGGQAKTLPMTIPARAPFSGLGPVSLYTDDTETTQVLAPPGWNCKAISGSDGDTPLDVWPPGASAPVDNGIQGAGTEGYVIPGADIEGQYSLICPLFPTSVSFPISGGADGGVAETCGPTPPKAETDTTLSAQVIAFHDPPGVSGTWDNSGNTNPADGVMIFNPGGANENTTTEMAVCILPPSEHDLCTASLDDFAAHYGGLKVGSTNGNPTALPTPPTTTTVPSSLCPATQLFDAAVAFEHFDPNDPSYAQLAQGGFGAGAYDPVCDAGWAVADISRPNVGTTDGATVFSSASGSWVEIGQVESSVAQCNLEALGVPPAVALVLAQGVVNSGDAGC